MIGDRALPELSPSDHAALQGARGAGLAWAMDIITAAASVLGAQRLVDISGAHLVGAYHSGSANLAFLDWLAGTGVRVTVPTTLNASSADLTGASNGSAAERQQAQAVVDRLLRLGATPTLTCAPYFLSDAPQFGDRLAWAESNAVIFANTVIGARTLKCHQYLDLACAICGRAPEAGPLRDDGRRPGAVFDVSAIPREWFADGIGHELTGFHAGRMAGERIPLFIGMPHANETGLRSLCAALGVTGSMPMAHIDMVTPEAATAMASARETGLLAEATTILPSELIGLRSELGQLRPGPIDAVAIGAPHASPRQIAELASAVRERGARFRSRVVVSLGRHVWRACRDEVEILQAAGAEIVRDTCTYYGEMIGRGAGNIVTGSVKWAAYGRAALGCDVILGNRRECEEACFTGHFTPDAVFWDA